MATKEQVAAAEAQIVEQSKKIDYFVTDYSVELLVQKMQRDDFEIPTYQPADVWEPARKSRFIESVLMGLPIPLLLFWENRDTGKYEIVDGSQRLRTLQQFLSGELVLGELEVLNLLEGFRFSDLPDSRQRKIVNRPIRSIILNEHADEDARFEMFDRINTGSKIANAAEVRRGAHTGPFLDMVIRLSNDAVFQELAPVSDSRSNLREREELITRFFAYGDGLDEYQDRVSRFLSAYARKMNKRLNEEPAAAAEYEKRFTSTMEFAKRVFPYGFRRAAGGTVTPRTRFEALAIGSYLALKERPSLANETIDAPDWLEGEEFRTLIGSDGANARNRLNGRMHFVRDRLLRKRRA